MNEHGIIMSKNIFKCKECYNDFLENKLIWPIRGYPYCFNCFDNQSLYQKRNFKNKFLSDNTKISQSIKRGKMTVSKCINELTIPINTKNNMVVI